jgi:glycosyltransferase involved in cell wall biosynthesis
VNNIPKISIIIPVYKAEKFLVRCLDSIVAQTFLDWECILIDDCSPDNSDAICKHYVEQDSRFLYIKLDVNSGAAAARNRGLDQACGDYIGFVDSDDFIDPRMYEILYKNAITYNSEISSCSAVFTNLSGEQISFARTHDGNYLFTRDVLDTEKEFPRVQMWASLFQHDFLAQNTICFDLELRRGQDSFFMHQCLLKVSKLYYCDEQLYHYIENAASTMHESGFCRAKISALITNKKILALDSSKRRRSGNLHSLARQYISILLSNTPPRITSAELALLEKYYPKSRVENLYGEHPKWVKFIYRSLLKDCWKIFFLNGYIKVKIAFLASIIIPLPLLRFIRSKG